MDPSILTVRFHKSSIWTFGLDLMDDVSNDHRLLNPRFEFGIFRNSIFDDLTIPFITWMIECTLTTMAYDCFGSRREEK